MEVKKMLPALPNNNNNSQNTENEPVKHDNVSGKQNIKDNSSKDEPKSEKVKFPYLIPRANSVRQQQIALAHLI